MSWTFRVNGVSLQKNPLSDTQTLTNAGVETTYVLPLGAYQHVRIYAIGGGGGGGGGGLAGGVGNNPAGGGGSVTIVDLKYETLFANKDTLLWKAGAGGTGGAGATVANGSNGADGGDSYFSVAGDKVANANGGQHGSGSGLGITTSVTTLYQVTEMAFQGSPGGESGVAAYIVLTANVSTSTSEQVSFYGAAGGGFGASTGLNGADGGDCWNLTGGLGGTAAASPNATAGSPGESAPVGFPLPGAGGGGGGGQTGSGVGKLGGNGGLYGGGAGGGGSQTSGGPAGDGGAGAQGIAVVVCY